MARRGPNDANNELSQLSECMMHGIKNQDMS